MVVGEIPLVQVGDAFAELLRRVRQVGIERIAFDRGVTPEELALLVETLARPERAGVTLPGQAADPLAVLGGLTRIRVGRLSLDERVEASAADVATIRRLYTDGVSIAGALWEMTQREGIPDPKQAKALVDSLAQAVAQNRTALMALTALKDYDNYTFTHMVNVSILVMAQARSLGIDGTLLREFGLAALMHDIGKVRTPLEVLNKPDKLTDAEFAIMRMHVVDGAEILRRTPEIPALAPVVAFEHHLRLDGTGYPMGVKRASLNLGTMLCSISDVYDAMRSQRAYQGAYPTDRILAVLQKSDGLHFDQHLVRRFSQLMGLYPPGNMVRLDTGHVGVVIRSFAPDPRRPRVRVIIDAAGHPPDPAVRRQPVGRRQRDRRAHGRSRRRSTRRTSASIRSPISEPGRRHDAVLRLHGVGRVSWSRGWSPRWRPASSCGGRSTRRRAAARRCSCWSSSIRCAPTT